MERTIPNTIAYSLLAGAMIAIGGMAFLLTESTIFSAIIFSVALLCICNSDYYLYTGKIGYAPWAKKFKSEFAFLLLVLVYNIVGAGVMAIIFKYGNPSIIDIAKPIVEKKLLLTIPQIFFRAFGCGMLMYMAVSIYKNKQNNIGIIFCIPAFILAGFEHSIADVFYIFTAEAWSVRAIIFTLTAILGNTCGSLFLSIPDKVYKETK